MSYIFQGPELTGRIVYADDTYQMNEHGDERVAFSDEEWAAMMADPAFGYVCSQGHTIDQSYAAALGGCRHCDAASEAEYEELQAEEDGYLPADYDEDDPGDGGVFQPEILWTDDAPF